MRIDDQLISYLEDISCLSLSADEKKRLTGDLQGIIDYMGLLQTSKPGDIDSANIPERSHPFDNVNAFRNDEMGPSYSRELILKNAPARNEEMFIAPKTVE